MKTYCKTISPEDPEEILPHVAECFRTKWRRGDYQGLLRRYSTKTSEEIRLITESKQNRRELFEDELRGISCEIARRIKERRLDLPPVRYELRRDGMSGKEREIGLESPLHQICEHVASGLLNELFRAKIGHYQCASIKGRGQIFGVKAIRKFIEAENRAGACVTGYGNKARYFVKADIEKCYPSMHPEMVMRWLRRDIGKNKTLLWFVGSLLEKHENGLIIGSILSKDLCNYLLSYAYREVLGYHKERRGRPIKLVAFTLFYMDDIVAFGPDKRNLRVAMNRVDAYLRENFGLHLKIKRHVKAIEKEPLDMMGYVIHADGHVTIRDKVFLRARRTYLRAKNGMTADRAQRVISYKGYFVNSDSKKASKRLETDQISHAAGRIISVETKRRSMECST